MIQKWDMLLMDGWMLMVEEEKKGRREEERKGGVLFSLGARKEVVRLSLATGRVGTKQY